MLLRNKNDDINENIELQEDDFDNFSKPFTMDELKSRVNDLKLGKAGEPDGILHEMIKYTLYEIAQILLPFYNRILITGEFPES